MRVVVAHVRYRIRGGEDSVFEKEVQLLRDGGIDVVEFVKDNRDLNSNRQLRNAIESVWSLKSMKELSDLIKRERPALVHFHNTHPQLSPSCYKACDLAGIPVVQTLHNFRAFCANGLFLRDGKVCEDCTRTRVPWAALKHSCFRDSRSATGAIVVGQIVHRTLRTLSRRVDRFIALSKFSKAKFISNGIPADRISVRGNYSPPPKDVGGGALEERSGCIYVGRLSEEKGISTLLAASEAMPYVRFVIAGDGPLRPEVESAVKSGQGNIEYLGRVSHKEVLARVSKSRALILPSLCYENFPATLVEAMACGTPSIVSNHGAMAEIISDGVHGLHMDLGEVASLCVAIRRLVFSDEVWLRMHQICVARYCSEFSEERSRRVLLKIYDQVIR
jgi:glycosyltransferase involved in cell wall biosynthesis